MVARRGGVIETRNYLKRDTPAPAPIAAPIPAPGDDATTPTGLTPAAPGGEREKKKKKKKKNSKKEKM